MHTHIYTYIYIYRIYMSSADSARFRPLLPWYSRYPLIGFAQCEPSFKFACSWYHFTIKVLDFRITIASKGHSGKFSLSLNYSFIWKNTQNRKNDSLCINKLSAYGMGSLITEVIKGRYNCNLYSIYLYTGTTVLYKVLITVLYYQSPKDISASKPLIYQYIELSRHVMVQ